MMLETELLKKMRKTVKSAFSIIEVVIVLVILIILAGVTVFGMSYLRDVSIDRGLINTLSIAQLELHQQRSSITGFPEDIENAFDSIEDLDITLGVPEGAREVSVHLPGEVAPYDTVVITAAGNLDCYVLIDIVGEPERWFYVPNGATVCSADNLAGLLLEASGSADPLTPTQVELP